jgi:ribosomal protein L37AE/L43A
MSKKPPSWRVCPKCKSRATKIFSLATGKYQCQLCNHEYDCGVPRELAEVLSEAERLTTGETT